MARIKIFEDNKPIILDFNGEKKAICNCGLSQNFPFCDGSHNNIKEDPEKVYVYIDGSPKEIEIYFSKNHSCCGGSCCSEEKNDEEHSCGCH